MDTLSKGGPPQRGRRSMYDTISARFSIILRFYHDKDIASIFEFHASLSNCSVALLACNSRGRRPIHSPLFQLIEALRTMASGSKRNMHVDLALCLQSLQSTHAIFPASPNMGGGKEPSSRDMYRFKIPSAIGGSSLVLSPKGKRMVGAGFRVPLFNVFWRFEMMGTSQLSEFQTRRAMEHFKADARNVGNGSIIFAS